MKQRIIFRSLCSNFQLRSGGSQILESCIAEIPNISSLDLSDNGEMTVTVLFYSLFTKIKLQTLFYIYARTIRICEIFVFLLTPGLDSELSALLVWLARNRSIKHLSLGKNFNNIKSKYDCWEGLERKLNGWI